MRLRVATKKNVSTTEQLVINASLVTRFIVIFKSRELSKLIVY